LGRQVIVEYRCGASGNIGAIETVARWRERGVQLIASTPDAAAAHLLKEVRK